MLAERVGFEPTVPFPVHALSRRVPSATRPSLRAPDPARRRSRWIPAISARPNRRTVSTRGERTRRKRWRRGRDSNPRYGFPYADLANLCLQPLGHLSGTRKAVNIAAGLGTRLGRSGPKPPPADAPRDAAPCAGSRGRGGEGGIRTLEALARLAVFKTAAFDRSATSPRTRGSPTRSGSATRCPGQGRAALRGRSIAFPHLERSGDGMALPPVDGIDEHGRSQRTSRC